MKRSHIFLMTLILALGLSVSAHATLINMGDGTIYDTDLQLSWIQNANTNGLMTWSNANTWANNLAFAGFDNWRLPTTLQPDLSCSDQGQAVGAASWGYNCTGSEMGHLYYTELGNSAGSITNNNTGDFISLQLNGAYWSGTEITSNESAWIFSFYGGVTFADTFDFGLGMSTEYSALAVSPGQRSTLVPEPATLLLLGSGLAGLGAWRRRKGDARH